MNTILFLLILITSCTSNNETPLHDQPAFSFAQLQSGACEDCKNIKGGFPAELQFGTIKSIKTSYLHVPVKKQNSFVNNGVTYTKVYESPKEDEVEIDSGLIQISNITYTKSQKILKKIKYDQNGVLESQDEVQYNEDGFAFISKKTTPKNGIVTTQTHDLNKLGHPLFYTEESADGKISKYYFEYNEANKIKKIIKKMPTHTQTQDHLYEYDEFDNLTKSIKIDSNMVNNMFGKHLRKENTYQYNDKNCIVFADIHHSYNFKYEYDSEGCLTKITQKKKKVEEPVLECTYNSLRQFTSIIDYSYPRIKKEEPMRKEFEYEYDEIGNWIKKTTIYKFSNDSKPSSFEEFREIEYY